MVLLVSNLSANKKKRPDWVMHSIHIAEQKVKGQLPLVLESRKLLRSKERGFRSIDDWTSGFYLGLLWYLHEFTKEDYWQEIEI